MNRRGFLKTILGGAASTLLPSLPWLGEEEAVAAEAVEHHSSGWVHIVCQYSDTVSRKLWVNGSQVSEETFKRLSPASFSDVPKQRANAGPVVVGADDALDRHASLDCEYPFSVSAWVKQPSDSDAQKVSELAVFNGGGPTLHWKADGGFA